MLDDRKDRFGFKIKDAELIGFPYTLIIGKGLKNGTVEILHRAKNKKETISIEDILDFLQELLIK